MRHKQVKQWSHLLVIEVDILVPYSQSTNGYSSDKGVESGYVSVIIEGLAGEAIVPAEPELRQSECNVLIEEEKHEEGKTHATPTAVHKEQSLQEPELCNGVIGVTRSLVTFLSEYANANMRSLNHVNVIGAIANSQSHRVWFVLFDHLNH